MLLCLMSTVIGILFLCLYVPRKIKCCDVTALMLKSAVSFFFIAVGLSAQAVSEGCFGYFVLGGLVCGLLGDVWLDLKFVCPDEDEKYTYAGFLAFAVGHVLFIIGMLLCFGGLSLIWFAAAAIGSVVIGFCAVFAAPLLEQDYGKYKGISLFYAPLLFGTTAFSAALSICTGFSNPALTFMLIGGVLFALSDLVLGGTYFGKNHDKPIDIILNYVFYYGAQFVIAWSILFS